MRRTEVRPILSRRSISGFANARTVRLSYFGSLEPCSDRPTESLAIQSGVSQAPPSPFLQDLPLEGGKH